MTSILSLSKRMFNATNSNAIISKSKNMLWMVFWISGIYIKLGILWKKHEPQRLFVSEIIDCKKRSYLNASKAPCQKTFGHLWRVNMLKCLGHCINLHSSIFVILFDHSERKSARKTLVLVVSEILRLLVNILTPDDKHSLWVKPSVYRNQFKCNYLQI